MHFHAKRKINRGQQCRKNYIEIRCRYKIVPSAVPYTFIETDCAFGRALNAA